MYRLNALRLEHSPRSVKFWECCLAVFFEKISLANATENDQKKQLTLMMGREFGAEHTEFFLDTAFKNYVLANKKHRPAYDFKNLKSVKETIFKCKRTPKAKDGKIPSIIKHQFMVNSSKPLEKPKIAVANTKVLGENILRGMRNDPNMDGSRYNTLYKIFQQTKEEKADVLLFPECFVPIELLDRITWFAVNEQKLVVTGLEHITVGGICYNFIVTILPFEKNGIKDAVVVYRLKNHYSHGEELMIKTNHFKVPKLTTAIYDLFIWRGVYFSPYYCFELADVTHRSLFKGKIDLLIASEWNPDVNYFSNIVESISRDLHVYVAQVNTSQFGDTRITQPSRTEIKDILKLKGGENDTVLTGIIDLKALRAFQREKYISTKDNKLFKPLPPDYPVKYVLKRIKNLTIFK
uniref:hypothetical protein n=1 Tax=Pedobacter schmidteae TaxID=2201271 RepID=UPI000EB50D6E|nr:hypothetical protein [Pedobacter schmidteae]